jgi:hypothetical protein
MAEEKQILWIGELILALFVFLAFLAAISYIRDPTFHSIIKNSKDLPLFYDTLLASPHNMNSTFIIPSSTKLIFDQSNCKLGITKISKLDNEAILYYCIKNENLMNKIQYNLKQGEKDKAGEFNISIKNE